MERLGLPSFRAPLYYHAYNSQPVHVLMTVGYLQKTEAFRQPAQIIPFHFGVQLARMLLVGDQPWFVAGNVSGG